MLRKVVRGSILTGLGLGLISVFEYLYVVGAGNLLPPDEFGRLNTVVAFLAILVALATAGIGTSVAKFVASCREPGVQSHYISSGVTVQLVLAGIVMGVLVLSAVWLKGTRLDDITSLLLQLAWMFPVLALAVMLPFIFVGFERIVSYNAAMLLNVALRVVALFPFVYFGRSAEQALLAYLIGGVVTVLFSLIGLRDFVRVDGIRKDVARELFVFSVPVTLSSFLVILFTRADVIVLKILLHEEVNLVVGQYSAPATLARGVFFLSSAVAVALLPAVSKEDKIPFLSICRLMVIVGVLLVSAITLAAIVGDPIVAWLFPQELEELSYLLPYILVAMALLSLAYLLGTVLIAVGRPGESAAAFVLGVGVFVVTSLALVPDGSNWPLGKGTMTGLGANGVVIALVAGAGVAFVVSLSRFVRLRPAPPKESLELSRTLPPMIDGGA